MDCFRLRSLSYGGQVAHARNDEERPSLLPRHFRSADTIAVELLVLMHVDRHPQQPAGEFERRGVVRLSDCLLLLLEAEMKTKT